MTDIIMSDIDIDDIILGVEAVVFVSRGRCPQPQILGGQRMYINYTLISSVFDIQHLLYSLFIVI